MENTTAIYDTVELQGALVTIIQKTVPGIPSNQYEITPKDENHVFLGVIQKCRKALLDTFKVMRLSTFHFPHVYDNHPAKLATIDDLENLCTAIKNFNRNYVEHSNEDTNKTFNDIIYTLLDVFDTLLDHEYIGFFWKEQIVTLFDRFTKLAPPIISYNFDYFSTQKKLYWLPFLEIFLIELLLHRFALSSFLAGEKKTKWSFFSIIFNFIESIKIAINWTFQSFIENITDQGKLAACVYYGILVFVMKYGKDFLHFLITFNRKHLIIMTNNFMDTIEANNNQYIIMIYKEYGKNAQEILKLFFANFHCYWEKVKDIKKSAKTIQERILNLPFNLVDDVFYDNFILKNTIETDDTVLGEIYTEYNYEVSKLQQRIINKYIGRLTYNCFITVIKMYQQNQGNINAPFQTNNPNDLNNVSEDSSSLADLKQ